MLLRLVPFVRDHAGVIGATTVLGILVLVTVLGGVEPRVAEPSQQSSSIAGLIGSERPSVAPQAIAEKGLSMDFRGDVWVRLLADGQPREDRLYKAGESMRLNDSDDYDLWLGDVRSVAVYVDGRHLDAAEMDRRSQLAYFKLVRVDDALVLRPPNIAGSEG